jgi:DUF1365 family protein
LSARALLALLAAFPFMTLKVIAAIHWQAFRLWRKRTPFHGHPPPAAEAAGNAVAGAPPGLS